MPTRRPSAGKIHASRTVRQLRARRAAEEAEEALRAQRPTRVAGWRSAPQPVDAWPGAALGSTSTWTPDAAAGHVGSAAEPVPGIPTWDVTARAVPTQVRRIPRKDLALAAVLVSVLVAAAGLVATSGGDDRITIEDAAVSLTPAPSTSQATSPSTSTTAGSVTDPSTAESSGAPVVDPGAVEARVRTRRSVGTTAGLDRRGPSSFAEAPLDVAAVPVPPLMTSGPVAPPEPPVTSETSTPPPSETTTTTPTETPTSSTTTTPPPPLPPFPPLPPVP